MPSIHDVKSQCVVWDFRANKDAYTEEQLKEFLKRLAKKWCFQLESSDGGYEHWQGRFSLFKARRGPEVANLMKNIDFPLPNYCQPTTTQDHKTTNFYCMKEDTRLSGPFTNKEEEAYIPIQYRNITLWPYQEAILQSANEPNWRVIDCIVDLEGCNGKSTIASIAELTTRAIDLPPCNDADKLIQSVCDILMAKEERKPGLMFMDMPRAMNKKVLNGMYAAIEQVKKGKVFDMRYAYKAWWFDSPRIWVFTNTEVDESLMSRDRWRFWQIDKDTKQMVPYAPKFQRVTENPEDL